MKTMKPGEMKIVERNGHMIHLDSNWQKLLEMLEKDKDRIISELEAEEKQGEKLQGENNLRRWN